MRLRFDWRLLGPLEGGGVVQTDKLSDVGGGPRCYRASLLRSWLPGSGRVHDGLAQLPVVVAVRRVAR